MRLFLPIIILTALCALTSAQSVNTLTGKVVSIADGDTITVLDNQQTQRKVRLNGIDAPESSQAFGQVSKQNLADLVFGKTVSVEWRKADRYGRIVGTVYIGGVDANLEQLKAGLAWYFVKYESDVPAANRKPYANAEAEAKQARRGLWADAAPVAPWDYRHPEQAVAAGGAPPLSKPNSPPAQTGQPWSASQTTGVIIGNRNSKIYHLPNCPDYDKVSERNRAPFNSEDEAVKAGFRKARNCP